MEIEGLSILKTLVLMDTSTGKSTLPLAEYVADVLASKYTVKLLGEGEKNLVAYNDAAKKQVQKGQHYFAFCGHMDTVPADQSQWKISPFELHLENDKYFGLGTSDMKGPISCMISALLNNDPCLPAGLILTYDEEGAMSGANYLVENCKETLQGIQLIIGEPTSFRLGYMHKGFSHYVFSVTGKGGHSSLPEQGLNAVYAAADFTQAIAHLSKIFSTQSNNGSTPTLNVGKISGGDVVNRVAEKAIVEFEARYTADKPPQELEDLLEGKKVLYESQGYTCSLALQSEQPAAYTDKDSIFIRLLSYLSKQQPTLLDFATDASIFNGRGEIPCAILGPGNINVCHQPNEYITRADLLTAEKLYADILESQIEGLSLTR